MWFVAFDHVQEKIPLFFGEKRSSLHISTGALWWSWSMPCWRISYEKQECGDVAIVADTEPQMLKLQGLLVYVCMLLITFHGWVRYFRSNIWNSQRTIGLWGWLRGCQATGRTHQIRVHFASIQQPLVGDETYGAQKSLLTCPRLFLHCQRSLQTPCNQSIHASENRLNRYLAWSVLLLLGGLTLLQHIFALSDGGFCWKIWPGKPWLLKRACQQNSKKFCMT